MTIIRAFPPLCLIAALFTASVPGQAVAEEVDDLNRRLEAIMADQERKIEDLERLIEEIKSKMEAEEQEDQLAMLLEEAEKLTAVEAEEEQGVGHRFTSGLRQQQKLNPNISVSGDFFGGVSTSDAPNVTEPGDLGYGSDGFHLRELSLSFIAPLDPFTRGKTFLSFLEDEIVVEEAYMEWLNLPGRMNVKMGLFNAEFGLLNRYHDHALPQFDRPRVLVDMFSTAPVGGLGLAGNFLLKPHLGASATNLDYSLVRGGAGFSFTDQGRYNLLHVGNVTNFYELSRDTYFEWRLGSIAGHNDLEEKYWSYVGDLGFAVKWVPLDRSKYRMIDWKTELLASRRETPGGNVMSRGFYTSLQNKLNARWWISGRVGYTELPYDNSQHEWDFTGCVDFWQSEFVFVRLQYQHSRREFSNVLDHPGAFPKDSQIVFHVCWAMGPHKHEAY